MDDYVALAFWASVFELGGFELGRRVPSINEGLFVGFMIGYGAVWLWMRRRR